ncbi:MAG: Ig-like domain repeat protein, partial [Elusimicrobiota bacterium]
FAAQPWTRDHFYVARASATDLAGNMQVALSSAGFTYEIGVPTATLNTPAVAYLNDDTPQLVGTAEDSPAGVASVELSMSDNAGAAGSWLTAVGGSFTGAAEVFVSTSAGFGTPAGAWYRSVAGIPFANGKTYQITLRTRDYALPTPNERTRAYSLLYDNARPTAYIGDPAHAGFKNANFTISGTSDDPGSAPSGVSTVTISIQHLGTNDCYVPGTGFAPGCPNFFGAGGTVANWSFMAGPNPFSNGQSYLVLAQAADRAGKVQNVYTVGQSSNVFTYADVRPDSRVTAPNGSQVISALSQITGTASSAGMLSTIQSVGVSIGQKVGPVVTYYEAGAFSSAAEKFLTANFVGMASGTWTYPAPGLTSGLHYRLRSKTTDYAGNVEDYAAVTQIDVLFDQSKPTGTVSGLAGAAPSAYQLGINPVTGAAFDNPAVSSAGLAALSNGGAQVRILERDTSKWWDTGVGQFNQSDGDLGWFDANSGSPDAWSYSDVSLDGQLVTGRTYIVQFRGRDTAVPANLGPSSNGVDSIFTLAQDSVTFIADKVPARSTVTYPIPGTILQSVAAITGTAADDLSGIASAAQIEVSLQELSPNSAYWDGVAPGTFTSATEIFYPVSGLTGGAFAGGIWTFDAPLLQDQFKYRVRVRARDNASPGGNMQPVVSSITFSIDLHVPGVGITYPISLPSLAGNFKNLMTLSGTANNQLGVRSSSVCFQDVDTLLYYSTQTLTFNSPNPNWVGAALSGSAPNYTWTLASVPLQDNKTYNLWALAYGFSGMPSALSNQVIIRFDQTPPQARVNVPAGHSFLPALNTVSGTSEDPNSNPSPLAGTEIRIQRDAPGYDYWNGTGWGAGAVWLNPSAGSPWTKNTQLPPATNDDVSGLTDGRKYTVEARAYDVAGNTQTVLLAGASFYFDVSAPAVLVQMPADGSRQKALPSIYGTAEDVEPGKFNVKFPEVRIYDIPINRYWLQGTGWVDSGQAGFPDIWNVAVGSSTNGNSFTWTYDASAVAWPDRDHELRVETRVRDEAGNYTVASATFSFDATKPVSLTTAPAVSGLAFSSMTAVSGTSLDMTSPIKEVRAKIWYLSGGATYYWCPGQDPRWQTADPGFVTITNSNGPKATLNPWTYASSDFTNPASLTYAWRQATHDAAVAPLYGHGKTFYIITRAEDTTGNLETAVTTRTFVFDNEPPKSGPAAPGPDQAYRTLAGLSGTSVDLASPVNTAAISIFAENGTDCPNNRYFDGGGFVSASEVWLSILPQNLFQSSWTYSSINLNWKNGCHYVVKSSATDAIGNMQNPAGSSRMLFDDVEPISAVTNISNGQTYPNYQAVGGSASDPGFTAPGITGTGSGVYPSLPWNQGRIQIRVFRDTEPYMAVAGPVNMGAEDDSGFYWDGAAWGLAPTWVDATFDDALGNWQYGGLKCPAAQCWVNGDQYVVWSRSVDNAGSTQTVVAAGPKFQIASDAQSFALSVSANPMTAGNEVTLFVEAKDGLNGTGARARGYVGVVVSTADASLTPSGPETMDDDDIADDSHGLPREQAFTSGPGMENGLKIVTIKLRKAGSRTIKVWDKDNPSKFGSITVTVTPNAAEKLQVVADYPLGQTPSPGKMGPAGFEGREGSPRTFGAGTQVPFLIQVVDHYWNLVVSSAASVTVADTDPNNPDCIPANPVVFVGSTTVQCTLVSASIAGERRMQADGQGGPSAANPSSPVPVIAQTATHLLALFAGEIRVQGKYLSAPYGKSGPPLPVEAGSVSTVTVYAVDDYYNTNTSPNWSIAAELYSDPYDAPPAARNLANGTTEFYFTPVTASTHNVIVQTTGLSGSASTYSTGLSPSAPPLPVWWGKPEKLQVLAEGQGGAPGKSPYTADPTTGGRQAGPAPALTAGVASALTVNLVDHYYNVVRGTTPFMSTSHLPISSY